MTKEWQFPAWEDMQVIDISKPLVTRSGRVAEYVRLDETPEFPVVVQVEGQVTTHSWQGRWRGNGLADVRDVQNPPEWAYAQYGIEPELEITMSVAIQHSAQCVELVEQLAKEPCRAPSYDCWKGKNTPCNKCASCRARAITHGEMPPLRRRSDGTSYRCHTCGQSEV